MGRIILGLGNPGAKYTDTPHNIGFQLVDSVSDMSAWKKDKKAYIQKTRLFGEQTLLVKPTTYMNLSGEAALSLMGKYKFKPQNLLVVVDDVNLPLGAIRIRKQGSDGGHNGLKSLIQNIGNQFPRLRIGVGAASDNRSLSSHVLHKMSQSEIDQLSDIVQLFPKILQCIFKKGYDSAASMYNRTQAP